MTQQDTQPPAETLADVLAQAALVIGNVPVSTMVGRCGWKKHSEALEGMRAILAALTRRAGGDAIPATEREALLTKALQRISAEPLHSLPIVTTQRMRNIADFALLGEDLA